MKKILKVGGIILLFIMILGCIGCPSGNSSGDQKSSSDRQEETTADNDAIDIKDDAPSKISKRTPNPGTTITPEENSTPIEEEPTQDISSEDEPVKMHASATTKVKIRKEANTDCDVLGMLDTGDTVEILDGMDGEWSRVNYNGIEGYVKSEFLAEAEAGTEADTGEVNNTDWKKELPFKYDEKYTTGQNLYIYLTENSISPGDLKKIIEISDLTGSVKPTIGEEEGSIYYDRQKVSIKDEAGEMDFELNKYDTGWKCNVLDYKVTGAHGMGIVRRTPENGHTYYITDLDHPLNHRMGVTSFDTLQEALKCIQDNYM